jgi:hypothetical protein
MISELRAAFIIDSPSLCCSLVIDLGRLGRSLMSMA